MPARKAPTSKDAAGAREMLLDGLAGDQEIFEVMTGLAPWHPRYDTFPGEVFLRLAADALGRCGASQANPVPLARIRERFLPECSFRGREDRKLKFAVLAAAAVHGGVAPDLLDEVRWWQTDDFWQYALFAAVACHRCGLTGGQLGSSPGDARLAEADPGHTTPRVEHGRRPSAGPGSVGS